ncbi:PEP-CTERM sorting domain-containing protein [Duganella sp. FT135W]|uniref:PEP-CTERM sorting domain-containing protein n=1 Tax=Duganella flavida TaxID=2692175 RepID=A0A6L8KEN1_9BURK|nr:NF038129 family PEP-CTERM protein [Duganella flavida]MYM25913.1 PEP-CTERM sorting domain-containing protein [Duganella flavida]
MFNTSITLRRSLLALALAASASLASAATYHVEFDTSSFGSTGWIDVLFNPGNANTPLASVTLTDFIGFGDSSTAQTIGNVTGSLASGYTITNDDPGGLNDLFHAVNFSGGKVGFNVSFSGAADPSQSSSGSVFSVALINAGNTAYLGTQDASGALVQLNWTAGVTADAGSVVAAPLVNTIPTVTAAVPEPSTWAMLAGGLALLGFMRRRQQA